MCGIVGYCGREIQDDELIDALKQLEYRGYDSAGIAVAETPKPIKTVGDVGQLKKKAQHTPTCSALAHTRWATHGTVTEENAHPHQDKENRFALVHNGIIENWQELKQKLPDPDSLKSQTDTELAVHYIAHRAKNKSVRSALQDLISNISGTYAFLLLDRQDGKLFAVRKRSPLVIGKDMTGTWVASDVHALPPQVNKAIFLEEKVIAEIGKNELLFWKEGQKVSQSETPVRRENLTISKDIWPHFMIKEIHESPAAGKRLILSLLAEQKDGWNEFQKKISEANKIIITGMGTSYHAAMVGAEILREKGKDALAVNASEFSTACIVSKDTLIIAISQSGETMDVVDALIYAKKRNAHILSMVNVPWSTVQRISETTIELLAGREICVAATKTFTNQILIWLALKYSEAELERVCDITQHWLLKHEAKIRKDAESIALCKSVYLIGRGRDLALAKETALKMKEIAYVHAEGMPAGELKHGTLALIEQNTPVYAFMRKLNPEMESNIEEIKARGGAVRVVTPGKPPFHLDEHGDAAYVLQATLVGQLLAYYIAKTNNLPIDKPRNLAKTVTVR